MMIIRTENQRYDMLSTAEIRKLALVDKVPGAMQQLHRRSRELRADGHPPRRVDGVAHDGYKFSVVPI